MARLPDGRREVRPSKQAMGDRRGPSFGPRYGVSVPISIGLPLLVIGGFVLITAATRGGSAVFWGIGVVVTVAGALLFATGKRL
ncbi:MAG: hypothetical protein H0V15_02725 [Solirubrobacterales bacterium]|nr:hypothetical protein [Solirubrobacterales bacterium]